MSDPLGNVPLSAIRVFEAAARLLSFTKAAQELGMTQAAVSWHGQAARSQLLRQHGGSQFAACLQQHHHRNQAVGAHTNSINQLQYSNRTANS